MQTLAMMSMSVLAAFGLKSLIEMTGSSAPGRFGLLIATLMLILLTPTLVSATHTQFVLWDGGMQPFAFDKAAFIRDSLIAALFLLLFVFAVAFNVFKKRLNADRKIIGSPVSVIVVSVCCLGLSLASEASITRGTLKTNAGFVFENKDPIPFLQRANQRVVSMGTWFFRPDINCVFGIQDFRSSQYTFARGYLNFLNLLGKNDLLVDELSGRLDNFLTSACDLAAIKYVVTREPVVDSKEFKDYFAGTLAAFKEPIDVAKGIVIDSVNWQYDFANAQVLGLARWRINTDDWQYVLTQLVLVDDQGRQLWSSPETRLSNFRKVNGIVLEPMFLSVPVATSLPGKMHLALRLINLWSRGEIYPQSYKGKVWGGLIDLGQITVKPRGTSSAHFALLNETKEGVRVYENRRALPAAYFVRLAKVVNSEKALEQIIAGDELDPRSEVLIEADQSQSNRSIKAATAVKQMPSVSNYATAVKFQPAEKIERRNVNYVKIEVKCPDDGYVVLSDTFYPGWSAFVDGKPTAILRANLLFRAVAVGKGDHIVEFKYQPRSFYIGLALAALACLIAIGSGLAFSRSTFARKK